MQRTDKLSVIDRVIIKSLLTNSRMPFAEIAEKCNVSTLTIKKRYERLKQIGVIMGSTVITNLCALGTESFAIFLITVPENQADVSSKKISTLLQDRSGVFCTPVEFNERYNIVLSLPFETQSDFIKVRGLLRQQPNIINIEVNHVSKMQQFPENLDLLGAR